MEDQSEPPEKKAKKADEFETFINNIVTSKTNLKAVVSDEYTNTVCWVKVYAGYVKDQKTLSNMIAILNRSVPLKNLQHLKRVHKSCVLLCPVHYLNEIGHITIQEFIENHVPELKNAFDYFKDIDVPLYAPKTKHQYSESSRKWACNFHPDKYVEKLMSNSFFSKEVLEMHRKFMGITLEVAKWNAKNNLIPMDDLFMSEINTAVVVDPLITGIVAVGFDNREHHPIQHATMVAIDNVAKTQNGGAWIAETQVIPGIPNDLLSHLKSLYPHTRFGSRKYLTKEEIGDSSKLAENPYLCTGYYVYLLKEPCVMCAMGLVHARVKRTFFCFDNEAFGALKSKTKLHCNPLLNHRFEVFSGFCS